MLTDSKSTRQYRLITFRLNKRSGYLFSLIPTKSVGLAQDGTSIHSRLHGYTQHSEIPKHLTVGQFVSFVISFLAVVNTKNNIITSDSGRLVMFVFFIIFLSRAVVSACCASLMSCHVYAVLLWFYLLSAFGKLNTYIHTYNDSFVLLSSVVTL